MGICSDGKRGCGVEEKERNKKLEHIRNVKDAVINSDKLKLNYPKPNQSADAIFNFMTEFGHLQKALENKMLSPRYCKEDIKYLKIRGLEEIAFPMKCFCDINLHKLHEHISWYGGYAIGFSKEYARRRGIQPITYINEKSMLAKDFHSAFSSALTILGEKDKNVDNMKNYLIHQLMYVKPVTGKTYNHSKEKHMKKCLTDEQEWRFVPSAAMMNRLKMKQAIIEKSELDKSVLNLESNALDGREECSILFEYSDIKYIMVMNEIELEKLHGVIKELDITEEEKMKLCTKVIVWNTWKGDL